MHPPDRLFIGGCLMVLMLAVLVAIYTQPPKPPSQPPPRETEEQRLRREFKPYPFPGPDAPVLWDV